MPSKKNTAFFMSNTRNMYPTNAFLVTQVSHDNKHDTHSELSLSRSCDQFLFIKYFTDSMMHVDETRDGLADIADTLQPLATLSAPIDRPKIDL